MTRYLPHAVVATAFVIALPAVGVWLLLPSGSPILSILSVLLAMGLSVAAASAASALWMRRPGSRDVVFADLMLWGWLRRLRAERRLTEAREVLGLGRTGQDPGSFSGPRRVAALKRLSGLLEARDAQTHGHTRRVTRHSERIARAMHLSPAEVAKVRTAAALHDVGKLHTPSEILNKPGRLSAQEFEVIKRHPVDGAQMLSGIGDADVTAMVRHHHERLDGRGYPDGLSGEQIPLGARIIAVADTFDAMTSNRAYQGACAHKRALDVLSEEAGAQLDAAAVSAFLGYYSGRRSVAWSAVVTAAPQRLVGWLGSMSERLGTGAASIAQALPAAVAAALLAVPLPGSSLAVPRRIAGGPPARRTRAGGRLAILHRLPVAIGAKPRAPRRSARTEPTDRPTRSVRRSRPPRRDRSDERFTPTQARSEAPAPPTPSAPGLPSRTPSPGPDAHLPPETRLPDPGALPKVELPPVQLPSVPLPTVELPRVDLPPVAVPDPAARPSPDEVISLVAG